MTVAATAALTIGETATALIETNPPTFRVGVEIVAAKANTASVAIGFSDEVTIEDDDATDGVLLDPGASIFIPKGAVTNAGVDATMGMIYAIAGDADQYISFIYW